MTTAAVESPAQSSGGRLGALLHRPELGVVIAALVIYAFFAVVAGGNGFLSEDATGGWISTAAEIGIIAIGVGSLMIAGEFDLSVGSMVAASSAIMAITVGTYDLNVWVAVAIVLVVSVGVGSINAAVVMRTRLPSFIVTLAMLLGLSGASLGLTRLLTGTTIVSVHADGVAHAVFGGSVGPVSATALWWIALSLVAAFVLSKSVFGNWIYAVGGDLESARTNGVSVVKVKTVLFITSSVCAGLVGVLQSVTFGSGDATRGAGFIFSAAAAAVIGGILLTGGYGTAWGIFFGAVTYGIVSTGIFYTGWDSDWTSLFLGVLVIAAVFANDYFRKLALAGGRR